MSCSRCGKLPTTGILHFNMPNIDGVCGACLNAKPARPVRVGDEVTCDWQGRSLTHKVERFSRSGADLWIELEPFQFAISVTGNPMKARHADGAPIDVEATLAALSERTVAAPNGAEREMAATSRGVSANQLWQQQLNAQHAQAAGNIDRALYANQAASAAQYAQQAARGNIRFPQQVEIAKVIDGQNVDLEAARKRIAELEGPAFQKAVADAAREQREADNALLAKYLDRLQEVERRANDLSDYCGQLDTEKRIAESMVGQLTLKLEAERRKAAKR